MKLQELPIWAMRRCVVAVTYRQLHIDGVSERAKIRGMKIEIASICRHAMRCFTQAVAALSLTACASIPKDAPAYTPAADAPPGYANLYIYRIGAYPTLRTPAVRVDGHLIFDPPEGAYTVVTLSQGKHTFMLDWAADTGWADIPETPFEIESGISMYFKISGDWHVDAGRMNTLSETSAIEPSRARVELRSCCRYLTPKWSGDTNARINPRVVWRASPLEGLYRLRAQNDPASKERKRE